MASWTQGNVSVNKGGVSGSWFGMMMLIIFLYYFVFRKMFSTSTGWVGISSPDDLNDGVYDGSDGYEETVSDVAENINYATLPNELTYYQNMANAIHVALSGFGEDEDFVFSQLYPLNGNEIITVYTSFGSRAGDFFSDFDGGDLVTWLKWYMRDSQQSALRQIFERTGGVIPY